MARSKAWEPLRVAFENSPAVVGIVEGPEHVQQVFEATGVHKHFEWSKEY